MKNKLTSVLLSVCMLASSVSSAEPSFIVPVVTEEPDVGAAVSPMKKGQTAPFTGVLFSPKATATVITELDSVSDRVAIEVAKSTEDLTAKADFVLNETKTQCTTDKKIISASADARSAQIKLLEDVLKKKEDAAPSRTFWAGLGFMGGVGVAVLTVFGVSKASK